MTEFHEVWRKAYDHQLAHNKQDRFSLFTDMWGNPEPHQWCFACLHEGDRHDVTAFENKELQRRYSWAIPTDDTIKTIAEHSPNGVVEIGAGGGYWAYELQKAGVDVIAYDPVPPGFMPEGEWGWHMNYPWTAVHEGDHTKAADHPDRTLLIVWPSYEGTWATEAVRDHYQGDTVVLVGEGMGGCTGDEELFTVLGYDPCYHINGESCDCPKLADVAKYKPLGEWAVPHWFGLHDCMTVHARA